MVSRVVSSPPPMYKVYHVPFETITAHRTNEAGDEHCLCCPDQVTTGDGAAFDIDDVLRQPEKVSASITHIAIPHNGINL
ncbi:hypothetical protein SAMN05414139_10090 [Burkholderia sp. D7]|nr:hypothetical protein SAMN05414139_10090 [Burkholderia sp. D7]